MRLLRRWGALLPAKLRYAVWPWRHLARWAMGRLWQRHTITVDVEQGLVRVVVLKGRKVVAWGTTFLHGDAETQDQGASPQERDHVAPLTDLLKELNTRHGRVLFSLPLHTPILRRLHLPKMGRRYLGEVVSAEVLETLPFTREEVDIAWQHRRNGTGHEVFAVATPKGAVEESWLSLRATGCRPAAAYSRAAALALALAGPVTNAIIVDLSPFSGAVVLVRSGWPEVVYLVNLSGELVGPEERAERLARAVEQVASYDEGLEDDEAGSPLPALVTGNSDPLLAEALERWLQRPVLPFSPTFVCPEHFPAHEYAANLGLAQAYQEKSGSPEEVSRQRKPSLNLLPREYSPRSAPLLLTVAAVAALPLLGLLAFIVPARANAAVAGRAALSSSLASLERQERSHRLSLAQADVAEKRRGAADQMVLGLESRVGDLQRDLEKLLAQLQTATGGALPASVQLSSLLMQQNGFVLAGSASSYGDVVAYAEGLRASGSFTDVRILRAEMSGVGGAPDAGGGGTAVGFQLKAWVATAPQAKNAPAAAQGGASP